MKVLKIDMGSEENQKYAGTILELPPQVQWIERSFHDPLTC
jgi:hypothetical protein